MGVGTAELRRLWDDLVNARAGRTARPAWLRLVPSESEATAFDPSELPPPELGRPRPSVPVVAMPPEGRLGFGRDRGFSLPQYLALVNGRRTAFCDAGRGPAVVLLHGPGGNLTHWVHVAPRLTGGFRVLGIDLPGSGESERPRGAPSVRACAEQVLGLLDLLRVERAAFVGHSLGANVAAELAVGHPDRVSRVALMDPVGLERKPLWLRAAGRVLLSPTVFGGLLPTLWRPALELLFAERNEYTCAFVHCLETTCRTEDLRSIAAAISGRREELLDRDLSGVLDHLAVPTLLAWGEEDPFVSRDALHAILARRPDFVLHEIRRCGPLPMIERPVETAALLRRHLEPLREATLPPPAPTAYVAEPPRRTEPPPERAAERMRPHAEARRSAPGPHAEEGGPASTVVERPADGPVPPVVRRPRARIRRELL